MARQEDRSSKKTDSLPASTELVLDEVSVEPQTQTALVASELRYRRLFETAQDAILIVDAVTCLVTDANPYIQKMLGYSHAEFVGRELWELGMFQDKAELKAAFATIQETGYLRFEHLPLVNKSGELVDAEFVSNLYDVDSAKVIQCNIRDITERRRLERETQLQSEALADLHRRKDEFIAMLSHELRNPLAPMANALRLMALEEGSPLQRQSRGIIERQLAQLTRLVDDLMEISRIATGRVSLKLEPLDIRGIVARSLESAGSLIGARKHQLHLEMPAEPLWLYADATRLEQVLVNLLTNAAKYTNDGGEIWLSAEMEGQWCVVRVRDTGIGISPEVLPRVFELFTQAERSLDRSQGGLGIGLALVRQLVIMHGGQVDATSTLGTGSEFTIRLPALAAQPEIEVSLQEELVSASGNQALRVLVVDDNIDAAKSLALLLTASGHDVQTVFDGPTAVACAIAHDPQVVLLDIGLPGLNGYEVAKKIRQHPGTEKAVLVAITGYGQEEDRKRTSEATFDHHLVKPADFGAVLDILASTALSYMPA